MELGKRYSEEGADELVFLDITASFEGRKTFTEMVTRVAREINIPFTVGGGINAIEDVERLLAAGADKVSVNSAALRRPQLISEITQRFGSQVKASLKCSMVPAPPLAMMGMDRLSDSCANASLA